MLQHWGSYGYSDDQWEVIKTAVRNGLGLDADQVTHFRTTYTQSLRSRIENAATTYIALSAIVSRTPGYKARIKRLTALRDRTETLGADIINTLAPNLIKAMHYIPIPQIDAVHKAIDAIDTLRRIVESNLDAQRPQPITNASKQDRDSFWNEMLAIWVDIGGAETGVAAADFLIATSRPVFRRVHAENGRKATAGMPEYRNSVVEWLRLRVKRGQRAEMRRKAS
jgi:hypothetical protein